MKNVRLILPLMALMTVLAAAVAGLTFGAVWAIVLAAAGILLVVMTAGYVQTKTLQIVTQRLSGLQKQNERTAETVRNAHAIVSKYPSGSQVRLPKEAHRAFEDLTLASRSLTVPQVHFDQLLRTISANTVRTEAALSDTVDEIRVIVDGNDSSDNYKSTLPNTGQRTL